MPPFKGNKRWKQRVTCSSPKMAFPWNRQSLQQRTMTDMTERTTPGDCCLGLNILYSNTGAVIRTARATLGERIKMWTNECRYQDGGNNTGKSCFPWKPLQAPCERCIIKWLNELYITFLHSFTHQRDAIVRRNSATNPDCPPISSAFSGFCHLLF